MRVPVRPGVRRRARLRHARLLLRAATLVVVALATAGCDKTQPAPPPPEMFDKPADPALPPEPAVPADTAAPPAEADAGPAVDVASAADAQRDASADPGAHPADSLLPGPCPLEGELASSCLRPADAPADAISVAHVLVAWRGTLPTAPPHRDEKAALKLAVELGHAARSKGMGFATLMHRYSDDPGEGVYVIDSSADGRFVEPFVAAARRLAIGSVDVVRSRFGFHVMKRTHPGWRPPPRPLPNLVPGGCPAEGEDAARCGVDRPPKPDWKAPKRVVVAQVLVAYKGAAGRRRVTRSRDDAQALAVRAVHAARRKGAKFKPLQERYSDDPGEGTYTVTAGSGFLPDFKRLARRLNVGGVDLVETRYGFHVLHRVE